MTAVTGTVPFLSVFFKELSTVIAVIVIRPGQRESAYQNHLSPSLEANIVSDVFRDPSAECRLTLGYDRLSAKVFAF